VSIYDFTILRTGRPGATVIENDKMRWKTHLAEMNDDTEEDVHELGTAYWFLATEEITASRNCRKYCCATKPSLF